MSALALDSKPADQSTDDLDLVAAVRAGDDRAFEQLFTRYQPRINAYVRGMVRDEGRAEDITQEVFIAALRRMRETDREILFKPWIYEIAKNACIDAFRRARNTGEVSFDAEDALGPADQRRLAAVGSAPDALIESKLAIDNLRGAFGGLSQAHRDILVMREFEGRSYREIGERMGMSPAGVESTLFRARRRLGEEYEELVSGERCLRVRAIADASAGSVVGLRDRRRLARHISHCQPCRRHALRAGVDLTAVAARPVAAARIAALLPLPSFLRRRPGADQAGQMFGVHGAPALNVIGAIDPSTASAWTKVVATAATVALAGLGAGAAVKHDAITDFVSGAPGLVGLAPDRPAATPSSARARALGPAVTREAAAGAVAGGARHRADRRVRRLDAAPAAPQAGQTGTEGGSPSAQSTATPAAGGVPSGLGGAVPATTAAPLGTPLDTPSGAPSPGGGGGGQLGTLLQGPSPGAGAGTGAGAGSPGDTGGKVGPRPTGPRPAGPRPAGPVGGAASGLQRALTPTAPARPGGVDSPASGGGGAAGADPSSTQMGTAAPTPPQRGGALAATLGRVFAGSS